VKAGVRKMANNLRIMGRIHNGHSVILKHHSGNGFRPSWPLTLKIDGKTKQHILIAFMTAPGRIFSITENQQHSLI